MAGAWRNFQDSHLISCKITDKTTDKIHTKISTWEEQGEEERELEYVGVRFEGNGSKKWDGKEVEVAGKTVVRLVEWTEEGLERAKVHWPGKGGKANKGKGWKCVVLLPESQSEAEVESAEETADAAPGSTSPTSAATAAPKRRASCGKFELEWELAALERQRTARELSEAAASAPDQQVNPTTSSTSTWLVTEPTIPQTTLPATLSGAAAQSGKGKGKPTSKTKSKPCGWGTTGIYAYVIQNDYPFRFRQ